MLKCRICCHAEVPNLMPLLVGATKVWWIKCRSLTNKNWIDDGEMEEEGLGEMLLDDNSTAQIARPGTSFTRPESSAVGGPSPAVRPTSTGGRPLSGFARPGSGLARGGTGMSLERAMTSRCFPLVQQLPEGRERAFPLFLVLFLRLAASIGANVLQPLTYNVWHMMCARTAGWERP